MDPIQCAESGELEFFKRVDLDVLQNAATKDGHGDSALKVAVRCGNLDSCEEILRRCPELLYRRNNYGFTVLHQAALSTNVPVIKLILTGSSKTELQDVSHMGSRQDDDLLIAVSNQQKKTALHLAVQNNNLVSTRLFLEADPDNKLLRITDKTGNTAMHMAVKKQNLEIVKLLSQSDSNPSYSANESGHNPVWIAFQEALAGDLAAVEIRKLLIEKQPGECNERTATNNWTVLHHAVYKGDQGTVEDIIRFSPDCLDLADDEGQNFLHLAAKFQHVNMVKYTVGIAKLPAGVLNGQDNDGNTPLHIAALGGQTSMIFPLLYDSRVNKLILNKQEKTALDMINFDYDKRRAGVHGLTNKLGEKEIKDQSDFDLVVGALIATVSFTAGITVPGGYIADGPNKGTAILAKKLSFKVFAVANTFALLLSLYAVFSHFCAKRLVRVEDLIYQLNVATYCSLGAIFAMVVAFIAGSYAVLAVTDEFAIFVCVLCSCFFLFAFRALFRMIAQNRPLFPRFGNGRFF